MHSSLKVQLQHFNQGKVWTLTESLQHLDSFIFQPYPVFGILQAWRCANMSSLILFVQRTFYQSTKVVCSDETLQACPTTSSRGFLMATLPNEPY